MNKEDILKALQTGEKSQDELSKLSPVSSARLHRILYELVFEGKISYDGERYRNIVGTNLQLGKVVTKKRTFVYLKLVREEGKVDVRLTGAEAEKMIVGDLAYLFVDFDRFGPRDCRFFCPLQYVDRIKGNLKQGVRGDYELSVPSLENAGVSVETVENLASDASVGDFVEAKILSREPNHLKVRIERLLVKSGSVGSDISEIIAANDAPYVFPQEVLDEARAIPQSLLPSDYEDRKDLREETIVTIDGDDSRDFDDAVSGIRTDFGWRVGIHIADVAHYVIPGHPLDDEARNRGTSIYVADRVVPMLPVELSNGICSLNPGVDRLAITVRADIDKNGNVIRSEVYPSVIRSHGRLTYRQVNSFFRTGESDVFSEEIKETLTVLKGCTDKVRARREKQGTMKLESTELHFTLDERGFPISVETKTQEESELMIEDLMIVANVEVAKLLHSLDIPTLYRIHENPPKEKLDMLTDFVKKLNLMSRFPRKDDISAKNLTSFLESVEDEHLKKSLSIVMLRSMAKARYSPDPIGHFGLAEPEYLHFTSPIRRYPDTIVHRTLHEYVFDRKPFDKQSLYDKLKTQGDDLSADEKRAQTIERSVDDLETAKYLSVRIGERFHGFISGFLDFGMFVQLDNGLEGLLTFEYMSLDRYFYDDKAMVVKDLTPGNEHEFSLGDPIDVCVFSANVSTRRVTFCSPEFMDELGLKLTPEQMESLRKNDATITTSVKYLADRHFNYQMTHRRPSRGGARQGQGGYGDRNNSGRNDSSRGGYGDRRFSDRNSGRSYGGNSDNRNRSYRDDRGGRSYGNNSGNNSRNNSYSNNHDNSYSRNTNNSYGERRKPTYNEDRNWVRDLTRNTRDDDSSGNTPFDDPAMGD